MTTPAVNIAQVYEADRVEYRWVGHAWVYQSTAHPNFIHVTEKRPASHKNPASPSGWRDPSPWSHSYRMVQLNPNFRSERTYADSTDGWLDYGPVQSAEAVSASLPAIPSWVSDGAISRALAQLKDEQVNLASDVYEWRQSVDLLVETVHRIASSVRAFRGRSPKLWGQVVKNGARNEWKNIPDEWLKLQYGWKPGMADTFSSCSSLSTNSKDYDARVQGVQTSHTAVYLKKVPQGLPAGGTVAWWIEDGSLRQSTKIILYYYMDNPLLASLASLGLTNPVDLVWEEVKFSFVVDWFLPIGNWLQNWDAGLGWRFKTGTRTDFSTTSGRCYLIPRSVPNGQSFDCDDAAGFWRAMNMNRTVYSAPPGVGLPHFKNPFTSTHISEALSLLVTAFR